MNWLKLKILEGEFKMVLKLMTFQFLKGYRGQIIQYGAVIIAVLGYAMGPIDLGVLTVPHFTSDQVWITVAGALGLKFAAEH